ncbi:MAG: exodeoxyribonuclease VII small subunit [Salinivirgaceae bacterium]|jgi:exodeoxyribonuclease VII small subunit
MAKKFSYKEATDELETIIEEIESGELEIDELGTKVKRVSHLIKKCKDHLRKTEEDISSIMDDFDER